MNKLPSKCAAIFIVILMAGCGGGDSPPSTASNNYNLQAGIKEMMANGLSSTVAFSGSATANGVSTAITGSGTFSRAPVMTATFNGTSAASQLTSVAGTLTAAGVATNYSTSVTDYFDSNDGALLGEVSASEYDVAQAPISFPNSVMSGSSGTLGMLSRYTDSTMSVPLGTAQVSYQGTLTPVDPGSPLGVALTIKVYDTQNTLIETDVSNYTLSSTGVIALISISVQAQSNQLTLTAD